jgi:hypothetical protein
LAEKGPTNLANGRKICFMTIKYTVILLSKAFQNIPKLVFLVYKNIASGNPV